MNDPLTPRQAGLLRALKVRMERRRRELRDGPPSVARNLGRIGVLGWTIVVPALLGLALGRWLDHHFDTGIFWTAPLIMVGTVFGCWSAWKWLNAQ